MEKGRLAYACHRCTAVWLLAGEAVAEVMEPGGKGGEGLEGWGRDGSLTFIKSTLQNVILVR